MNVDKVGSNANGNYDVDTVLSNSSLTLKVDYGDLSNGDFYTTTNSTIITT